MKRFTNICIAILLIVSALFFAGCIKDSFSSEEENNNIDFTTAYCTVDLDGTARDGLTVICFGDGFGLTEETTSFDIPISNMPQLLIVMDNEEHIRMLYRGPIATGQHVEINAHTSALAMVTCNPMVSMVGDSDYLATLSTIESLTSFPAFESVVQNRIASCSDLFDTNDHQLVQIIQVVFDELLGTENETTIFSKAGDGDPLPWAEYSPLKVEWPYPDHPGLGGYFYLSNAGLVPSYYGTITSTSGRTEDLAIPTVDRYTPGGVVWGAITGDDVFRGKKVKVNLSPNANNMIELTNLNDLRALVDVGAHFIGDFLTAISMPSDITQGLTRGDVAKMVGSYIADATRGDGPHPWKAICGNAATIVLQQAAFEIEKRVLKNSAQAWAKQICKIGMDKILGWYNGIIGVGNLTGRIVSWCANPKDISFCVWYGSEEGSSMYVDTCRDIYTVSYEVGDNPVVGDNEVTFELSVFLDGDVMGLRNADEYGYYIKYSNSVEYQSVERLNNSMFDYPYTYSLSVDKSWFVNENGQMVAHDYYIGFYVVRNNRSIIDTYDEKEIEGLKYRDCDCNLTSGDWVDLGLPSGLLWATRNVGASSPTDYGNYYAWGETQPKSVYDWSTYRYCVNDGRNLTKYCNNSTYYGYNDFYDGLTILQPGDDAATVNYGGRTPTIQEWMELSENTTVHCVTISGVRGVCFTGPNGNSIFLPVAGRRVNSRLEGIAEWGYYWSSSLFDQPDGAVVSTLGFTGIYEHVAWIIGEVFYRCYGLSVRAVRDSQNKPLPHTSVRQFSK